MATKKITVKKSVSPRSFVTCPQCQAKSKVLRTEFGGLQTRECKNGHIFEFDKWMADRRVWIGIV